MSASDVTTRLGNRFEVRAVLVGERIDIRGIEPRLSTQLPVVIEVAPSGCAALLRTGVVVLFGVDPIQQERFVADLGPRIQDPRAKVETERAVVRIGDADGVEPDAVIVKEVTIERLQVLAEVLGKSVILGRYELEIADTFAEIEPFAAAMRRGPRRLPWKQTDLVRHIGAGILSEHALVGRAEVLEKPDVLWDRPELDRWYARLEDEYELRERHLAVDTKLALVSRAAQTMLELSQTRRSLSIEYYILGLIVFEVAIAIFELVTRR